MRREAGRGRCWRGCWGADGGRGCGRGCGEALVSLVTKKCASPGQLWQRVKKSGRSKEDTFR